MSFSKEVRDLSGKKFNRLTVLRPVKKYDRTYLLCQCECGNTKEVKMSHVRSGNIKSCGCLNIEKLKSRKGNVSKLLKPDNYSAKYRLFKKYEKEANKRNYSFELDLEGFIHLTSQNCHYCGQEPNKTIKGRQSRSEYIYNGIDRLNNNLGYFIENCVPSCTQCNIAKRTLSKEDFLGWIKKVFKFNKIPFDVPSGPLATFDVDDTLVSWSTPEGMEDKEIEINCDGVVSRKVPNTHNITLLKKLYETGHIVVVWSGSGVKWCKAVVKALNLEGYIHGAISKPQYYIDDKPNPKEWMGKHGFFTLDGKRINADNIPDIQEDK